MKEEGDFAVVVGGYNSSNTIHLVELLEQKFNTFFVQNALRIESKSCIKHFDIHDKIELSSDFISNLGKQKYSLVYYLAVGDQNCSEPGILKLYEPSEDILPDEGMITIIPASRLHSAVYGGKTDRVMVGVNFYSL